MPFTAGDVCSVVRQGAGLAPMNLNMFIVKTDELPECTYVNEPTQSGSSYDACAVSAKCAGNECLVRQLAAEVRGVDLQGPRSLELLRSLHERPVGDSSE